LASNGITVLVQEETGNSGEREQPILDLPPPPATSKQVYLQGVPKKMSFLGKIAITTFKLIQNAKAGGVLENSGYLLPDGH
jgi:hypothetical protein